MLGRSAAGDFALCHFGPSAIRVAASTWRSADTLSEARSGATIYDGVPPPLHEWRFRFEVRMSATTPENITMLTARTMEALKGDALAAAMEIGHSRLMKTGGLELLVEMIQHRNFPAQTAEARELLKPGIRAGSMFGRIPREPTTTSYISRRRG